MKKTVLTSLIFLAFVPIKAQVSLGPKAGMNLATLTTDDNASRKKEFLPGLNAGIALNIGISERFSVQPELNFSQQGFKSEISVPNNPAAGPVYDNPFILTCRLNYISMPVLFKATFGHPARTRGFINAGPYLSYIIENKSALDFNGNSVDPTLFEPEQPEPGAGAAAGAGSPAPTRAGAGSTPSSARRSTLDWQMNDPKKFDFGITAGAGVIFPVGSGELVIDVRYTAGLSPVSSRERIENNGANRVFSTSLGYLFPLGAQ